MSEGTRPGDINDGDILAATRQHQRGDQARQFKYTTESGRVLTSEWFSQDKAKEAVQAWVEAVRNFLVQEAESARQEKIGVARKLHREQQEREAETARQAESLADSLAGSAATGQSQQPPSPPSFTPSDPLEAAQQQVAYFQELLKAQEQVLSDATGNVQMTTAKLRRAQKLVAFLETDDG